MLIPNKKKGWYGCFSEVGRRAARLNFLISKEPVSTDIKSKFSKKSLLISAFEASENKNAELLIKANDDNLDIFSIDETDKLKLEQLAKNSLLKEEKKSQTNKINSFNQNSNSKKFYYYHIFKKKKEKKMDRGNPPCTKYNPRYTSIFRRTASSPSWSTMKARGKLFEQKVDEHPFYIKHKNILDTMAGKSFIDMKKQKQIKNAPNLKDRNIYTLKKNKSAVMTPKNKFRRDKLSIVNKNRKRPYSGINTRLRRENYSFNLKSKLEENSIEYNNKNRNRNKKMINNKSTNLKRNKIIEVDFDKSTITKLNKSTISKSISNLKSENSKEPIDTSEDSYDSYKHIYKKKIKHKKVNIYDEIFTKEIIKAPDFKQMISRENLQQLKDDKIPIVPYLLPNFSLIRDRPIMMVVYDRKYHKINRNKRDSLIRVDNTFYYDPNEVLTKINNYTNLHPPNFKMMSSRPDDDDPLPSYMKRIYSRNGCYDITQLSLKLNNYKNRGFAKIHSSFFPKKSFNKIVNLNLLKSKKFLNNVIGEKKTFYRQFRGLGNSLKFYNKNYEEIIRDNLLEKFDNVTYKTIEKEHNKKIIELVNQIKKEAGE